MNVLLLSMPDYFEHMPPVAVRMPNGALTSLAGNVDSHHQVAVADLILSHRQVRNTVTRLVREFDPDVVGLSVMTFQRRTAGRIINLVRALKPRVKVVVGGYDPSLASEAYEGMDVDFIVRGEGEVTFANFCVRWNRVEISTGSAAFRTVPAIGGSTTPTGRYIGWKTMRSACPTVRHACSKATHYSDAR
jgi:radical SAM superfamily enzyme YgiQ (UPF0313 family)